MKKYLALFSLQKIFVHHICIHICNASQLGHLILKSTSPNQILENDSDYVFKSTSQLGHTSQLVKNKQCTNYIFISINIILINVSDTD